MCLSSFELINGIEQDSLFIEFNFSATPLINSIVIIIICYYYYLTFFPGSNIYEFFINCLPPETNVMILQILFHQ